MSNSGKVVTGLFIGLAAGVALGYFLNSAEGVEAMATAKEKAGKYADKVKNKAGEYADKVKNKINKNASEVEEVTS